MDVRACCDQGREAALGDLTAAEDYYSAAGEAEAYGVGGVFGHGGAAPCTGGAGAGPCGSGAPLTCGF
ncbi:hypothetical protein GCM10023080_001720 [Streptomyces pseudoechinosporeus]